MCTFVDACGGHFRWGGARVPGSRNGARRRTFLCESQHRGTGQRPTIEPASAMRSARERVCFREDSTVTTASPCARYPWEVFSWRDSSSNSKAGSANVSATRSRMEDLRVAATPTRHVVNRSKRRCVVRARFVPSSGVVSCQVCFQALPCDASSAASNTVPENTLTSAGIGDSLEGVLTSSAVGRSGLPSGATGAIARRP